MYEIMNLHRIRHATFQKWHLFHYRKSNTKSKKKNNNNKISLTTFVFEIEITNIWFISRFNHFGLV